MESRRNSSETSSQDLIRCSSATVKSLLSKLGETSENFTGKIIFLCRCSTTFLVEQETMNKKVWQTLDSYLCMQENLVKDNGHSLVLIPKRRGILWKKRQSARNLGQIGGKDVDWIRRKRMSNFPCYDFCPEVNLKAKDMVNCRFTLQPFRKRLRLFFAWVFLQISSVFTE